MVPGSSQRKGNRTVSSKVVAAGLDAESPRLRVRLRVDSAARRFDSLRRMPEGTTWSPVRVNGRATGPFLQRLLPQAWMRNPHAYACGCEWIPPHEGLTACGECLKELHGPRFESTEGQQDRFFKGCCRRLGCGIPTLTRAAASGFRRTKV